MLKVGDIVTVTRDSGYYYVTRNRVGKIILFDKLEFDKEPYAGIDFGEEFKGHNLNGKVKKNTHYWIESDCLELYKKTNKGNY